MDKQPRTKEEVLSLRFDTKFRAYLDHRIAHKNKQAFIVRKTCVFKAKEWLMQITGSDTDSNQLSDKALAQIATVLDSFHKWRDSQKQ